MDETWICQVVSNRQKLPKAKKNAKIGPYFRIYHEKEPTIYNDYYIALCSEFD